REIRMPAGRVFEAFTDPEQLVRWIGPGGPEATRVESEPGIGGATDVWITRDEGEKRHFRWETVEMDPPNRLVLDFAFGGPPGAPVTEDRSLLTLEIRETGPESAELTLTHELLAED